MSNVELSDKIDTLIRLQAHLAVAQMTSQKEKILFLARAGLGSSEIAEILGTSTNTVSVAMSAARKDGTLKRPHSKAKSSKGATDAEERTRRL